MNRTWRWRSYPGGRFRASILGAAAALMAATLITIRAVIASPTSSSPTDVGTTLDVLVCWAFVVAGILIARSRATDRAGVLCVATGLAWGLTGLLHRGPLAQLLLTDPAGRRPARSETAIVAFAWVDGVVGTFVRLDIATVILAVLIVVATLLRVARSTGVVRRSRIGPAIAGVAIAGVLLGGAVPALQRTPPVDVLLVAYELVLVATAVGLAADRLAGGWSGGAATSLVVDLGSRAVAGSLRDRLAEALGDRKLVAGFVDGDGALVDEAGVRVDPPTPDAGRAMTPITSDGVVLAVLIHDPALLLDDDLADAVTAATVLTIGNVRHRAEIQKRAVAVDASRRRILGAGYDQRLQMERSLLAGPARRLDAAARLVRAAVAIGVGQHEAEAADLLAEFEESQGDLQRFARAVFPPALAERDFRGALADLAARSAVPVDLEVDVGPLPAILESTIWFVCSEALTNIAKHANASRATLSIRTSRGAVRIEIADDGVGGADARGIGLRGLMDRVEAVGGVTRIASAPGAGTRLTIEAPLDPNREAGQRAVNVSRAPA